jgi:hypothetical protein
MKATQPQNSHEHPMAMVQEHPTTTTQPGFPWPTEVVAALQSSSWKNLGHGVTPLGFQVDCSVLAAKPQTLLPTAKPEALIEDLFVKYLAKFGGI